MNYRRNFNIRRRAIGFALIAVLWLLTQAPLAVGKAHVPQTRNDSFEGTYKGTAGDDQLDERWQITNQDGKWDVVGYYYWNKRGASMGSGRKVGRLAGSFVASNVRMEGGVLKFTQSFDQKPISTWADTTDIEATVAGDALIFKNQYVSGVVLKRT
jgi:hypothetical protein